MKKWLLVMVAFLLILCGCEKATQNQTPLQTESLTKEYPIVIVDTTNSQDHAYVVGFSTSGDIKTLDGYVCDGKSLRDFLGQDDAMTKSPVFDLSQKIKLVDSKGNPAEIKPMSMQCTERVLDEALIFQVAFEPSLPEENSFYIGTYSKIDIFPKEVTRQDHAVQVDLDTDGNMDRIEWSFSPTTSYYGVKNDYTISVDRNGDTYVLVKANHLPLEEEDLAVFVADLNGDKEYEIIVYANGMSQFGEVTVYAFADNQYSVMLQYAVDCEP